MILLLTLVAVAGGCSVRSKVDIAVGPNGGGSVSVEVRLDRAASDAVPYLADQLSVNDLKQNGWSVRGPDRTADGGATIEVVHDFDDIAEANAVLSQLSISGPFKGFELEQKRSIARSTTTFAGTVDLSQGIESFGDGVLRGRVGSPLGFDPAEVQRSLGVDWQKSFPVDVEVHMPGRRLSSSPLPADGVWHLQYGASTTLRSHASGINLRPLTLLGSTVFLLLMALAVTVLWKSGKYRPQHRHKRGAVRARDLLTRQLPETDTGGS